MNQVVLSGRLTKDPETRTTQSGLTITNITVATDDSYKKQDGTKVENPNFHRVVYMGGIAQVVAKHFSKGDGIEVLGSINYRDYEQDGERKYITEIAGRGFSFPPCKKETGNKVPNQSKPSEQPQVDSSEGEDDDLPF